MPHFSNSSKHILQTLDPRLGTILIAAIKVYDFTILSGFRTAAEQEQLFKEGRTKVHFPDSKHNTIPSQAVDIAPYPIDWDDAKRFIFLAGLVTGIAATQGVKLRWGGNWDMDDIIVDDQNFDDLPHFEISEV